MSLTPPERDDDSPALRGSGNPNIRYFAWGILVLTLYVLSSGPAWWLVNKHLIQEETWVAIFSPLAILGNTLGSPVLNYINLWVP
jgi:hypothetical protein